MSMTKGKKLAGARKWSTILFPALLSAGCGSGEGISVDGTPSDNLGATQEDLQLATTQDWSAVNGNTNLTACWITDDEFFQYGALRSTDEQAAINAIQAYIDSGWELYSRLKITWKPHCTTFTEDLRIYFDDVTTLSPETSNTTDVHWPHDRYGGYGPLSLQDANGTLQFWKFPARTGNVTGTFSGVCNQDHYRNPDGTFSGTSIGGFPTQRLPGHNMEDCIYNIYLTSREWNGAPSYDGVTTPFPAHYLHEFGHAIGFSHEQGRTDGPCPTLNGEVHNDVFLTNYDLDSVMHYSQNAPGCFTDGNYSQHMLSASDQLGVEILYPRDTSIAPVIGGTIFRDDQTMDLVTSWVAGGAYLGAGGTMGSVFKNFQQRIQNNYGTTVATGTASRMTTTASNIGGQGAYSYATQFDDVLGRHWTGGLQFQVLDKATHTALIWPVLM